MAGFARVMRFASRLGSSIVMVIDAGVAFSCVKLTLLQVRHILSSHSRNHIPKRKGKHTVQITALVRVAQSPFAAATELSRASCT